MNLRSYVGNLISRIPLEIDPHEGEPNYFDFVTYFGLVSLSIGTIARSQSGRSTRRPTSGAIPSSKQIK